MEITLYAFFHVKGVYMSKNQESKYSSGYALTGILLCGKCGDSETLEEGALNRAVMEVIHRITKNEGDFVGAFRQNVIRVSGSYGREQQPDEYTDRIKTKQEEIVALIAKNARTGAYTQAFDERYRRIAEEINALKEEQAEAGKKVG